MRSRQTAAGIRCPHCSYDLRSHPAEGTCPECGHPYCLDGLRPLRPCPSSRALIASYGWPLVLLALPMLALSVDRSTSGLIALAILLPTLVLVLVNGSVVTGYLLLRHFPDPRTPLGVHAKLARIGPLAIPFFYLTVLLPAALFVSGLAWVLVGTG